MCRKVSRNCQTSQITTTMNPNWNIIIIGASTIILTPFTFCSLGRHIVARGAPCYTAFLVCHLPRVKSGNCWGALPFATLASLSGIGALHAAAS